MVEFIGLNNAQEIYGKKYLLHSQMEILKIIQRYQLYKKLRKEELALKALLKRKIATVRDEINEIDRILPKTKHHIVRHEAKKIVKKESKRKLDLESQIADIKRRLAQLS